MYKQGSTISQYLWITHIKWLIVFYIDKFVVNINLFSCLVGKRKNLEASNDADVPVQTHAATPKESASANQGEKLTTLQLKTWLVLKTCCY